jgi:alkaline phosphatase D
MTDRSRRGVLQSLAAVAGAGPVPGAADARPTNRAAAENAVALTGDRHSFAAGYLKPGYGKQSEPDRRVGIEFLAPAVSSANVMETLDLPDHRFARAAVEAAVRDENPHVAFFDSHHWGFATVEFTPDAATYTAHAVEKSVPADRARAGELARFRTQAGRPDLTRL